MAVPFAVVSVAETAVARTGQLDGEEQVDEAAVALGDGRIEDLEPRRDRDSDGAGVRATVAVGDDIAEGGDAREARGRV